MEKIRDQSEEEKDAMSLTNSKINFGRDLENGSERNGF